jgi:hydrogenase maturation protease
MMDPWEVLGGERPTSVSVDGVDLVRGSRVRLMPRAGRDIFDLALAGRVATIESLEFDVNGSTHLVVTVDDDPARDFRDLRMPGHRFFFRSDEVEPLPLGSGGNNPSSRVLVAGIGNVFLGDDGFGVEVARAMLARERQDGVDVVDYGIRGMDLAYALGRYDAAILVDVAPRGTAPGTVAVVDPSELQFAPVVDTHGMDPVKVLGLARTLGAMPRRLLLVVCEPERIGDPEDVTVGLSAVVDKAVPQAVTVIDGLIAELLQEVAP